MPLKKGWKHTEETKQKMSSSKMGNINGFKKGQISWIKGKHHSEETKEKCRLATLNGSFGFKKGYTPWIKGKHHKPESIKKNSLAHIGKVAGMKGKKHKQESKEKSRVAHLGQRAWNKGLKMPEITRQKVRVARSKQIFPLKDTKIERKLHEILDSINVKYRKHFPVYHPKMGYHQVDIMFVDHEENPKIAVECDGCWWHGCLEHCSNSKIGEKNRKRDRIVDSCLKELGIKVIRLWEHDINQGRIPMEIYDVGDDE